MKTSKRNRGLSFLLALIMLVGMLPISVLSVGAESGGENAVGAPRGAAQVSASAYPALTNLVEGTEIIYGHVYFFYKNGRVVSRSVIIDPEDCTVDNDNTASLIKTAMRELHEETGLKVTEKDTVSVINPCLFSTPGMTDESNALVKIVLNRDSLNGMSQEGAVGGELFDGFDLLTKAQAKKILEDGVDEHGIYYSVYTWAALTYFVADLWR